MAFGSGTLTAASGAVSDLFAAKGLRFQAAGARIKEQGDLLEKENYLRSADFADKNVEYTAQSLAIKQMQTDRDISKQIGGQEAAIAGSGFTASGSALDILRESASQGALTKAVLGQQGMITEEGYQQQAQSYRTMASAADVAIAGEENAAKGYEEAAKTSTITGVIKGAAALASIFTPDLGGGGAANTPAPPKDPFAGGDY